MAAIVPGASTFKMARKDEEDNTASLVSPPDIKKVRAFPEATSSQTSTRSHWPELGHMAVCCEAGR